MKKITSIALLFLSTLGFSQVAPVDFEIGGIGTNWTWTVFENGTPPPSLEFIANPDPSPGNPSATVAKFTARVDGAPYAGCESLHGSDIGTFTLDASNSTVRIKVWKSVISDVGIKFATQGGASTGELRVANTVINQWEELTFNFAGIIGLPSSTAIDQIIIFPDFSARTTENIVYFDAITFGNQIIPPPRPTLPLDFESPTLTYTFTSFGGAVTTKIGNPDMSGINLSANVARLTKNPGETYAGSFIELDAPFDFNTVQSIKIKTWAPQAGITIKMKLENLANPTVNTEVDVTNTVANSWEELIFNFPAIVSANNYQRLVVFFNFGVNGTGENYYFDDADLGDNLSTTAFSPSIIKLYPNPAHNRLTIIGNDAIENFAIYSLTGQELKRQNAYAPTVNIDVSDLPSGTYILKTSSNGNITVSKLIKR